jgi:hypothetical protein
VGYDELRGVEVSGRAEAVGDVPRQGAPAPELDAPERIFAARYRPGPMRYDGRHAWLRIRPDAIVSWDFRKLAERAPSPPAPDGDEGGRP